MQAPSASNIQVWRFVIVDDYLVVKKLKDLVLDWLGDPQPLLLCVLIIDIIEEGKLKNMTDAESFQSMLAVATEKLVDIL